MSTLINQFRLMKINDTASLQTEADKLPRPPLSLSNITTRIAHEMELSVGITRTSTHSCEEAQFLNEADRHVRITFFFGQNRQFLVFTKPNNSAHQVCQQISLMVELWLEQTLGAYTGDLPILENSPQVNANAIMEKLRQGNQAFENISEVLINIRAGHVYLLHVIAEEIEIEGGDQEFFQEYPFFMETTIKVQPAHPSMMRHTPCQVTVAVEHVADTTLPAPHKQMACMRQYIAPGLYFNGASMGERHAIHP